MKNCGYCGRENADDAAHCSGCGTEFGAVESAQQLTNQQGLQSVEAADVESDVPPRGEAALCTCCLFPNLPESRWCKRCGAQMSPLTGLLMPDAAISTGFVYRRAVETPFKPVLLYGVWLHFFPSLLIDIVIVRAIFANINAGMIEFIIFWLAILGCVSCGSVLYRVTRNYVRQLRRTGEAAAA
jgi:hypothetical protein